MKYYKLNNQVYAFKADGSQDLYITLDMVAITEVEAEELRKPPPKTKEELAEDVRFALQSEINAKAKMFGFSSGDSVIQYAGFPNKWQSFALTFANWEVQIWDEADAYKAEVFAGTKPMLTPAEAVALMPVYPS